MMKLAIMIEGSLGLTWARWKRLVSEVDRLGFAGLFRSDHFTMTDPPDIDALELIVSLTYLATQNQQLHFGPLVAPFSFRDPIMLARQAMALDDLSGGRMILGVGAGWLEREHTMFGYPLGDVTMRMARFEEGLEVVTRLIRGREPVNFEGHFYQLREAHLLPSPARVTPILIGGNGPRRTLPLVAQYADIWNCVGATPQVFQERSRLLDDLLRGQGRQPSDVKRTIMLPALCWRNVMEREHRLNMVRACVPHFAAMTAQALEERLRSRSHGILGTPQEVIEQMQVYSASGAEEMMLQWFGQDDIEGLELLAQDVLPHIMS